MDTDDQVVPGWSDDNNQILLEERSHDRSHDLQPPLLTSTPAVGTGSERNDHRDSGYTSPPIGDTIGPNSPENTDPDGRLIQKFNFDKEEGLIEGQESGGVSDEEDSAFLDSEHQGVLLEQDTQSHRIPDTDHMWDTRQSPVRPRGTRGNGQDRLGQSEPASHTYSPSYIEESSLGQDRMSQSVDTHQSHDLRYVSHDSNHRLLGHDRLNHPHDSIHTQASDRLVGHAEGQMISGAERIVGLSSSYTGQTHTEHPLFHLSSVEEGERSPSVTGAIPVPGSHTGRAMRALTYNQDTALFHTPPRTFRLPHARTSPAQLVDQSTAETSTNQNIGATPRVEAISTETGTPLPRGRFYSEHQPPPDVPVSQHESHGDRRRSAPAVMYTAQLFGKELRRIGDEFEGSYRSPLGQAEERQVRNRNVPVRPRQGSNRRSFPGADTQETRWWEKIIQMLPIYSPGHSMGRHTTAPGPLCGRVTEENSDEEESESDGTADSTGQTEL